MYQLLIINSLHDFVCYRNLRVFFLLEWKIVFYGILIHNIEELIPFSILYIINYLINKLYFEDIQCMCSFLFLFFWYNVRMFTNRFYE